MLLSLDLSTKSTGYAIYDNEKLTDYGLIKPKGNKDLLTRIENITEELEKIIISNKTKELVIIAEEVPPAIKNTNTIKVLYYLQGHIRFMLRKHDLDITFSVVSHWRKLVGINSKQSRKNLKTAAIERVNELFNISTDCDDIAEAILIGYSYFIEDKKDECAW